MHRFTINKTDRSMKLLCLTVVAATVWAVGLGSANAASSYSLVAPNQIVMIGDNEEIFEANLLVCHNNQANGQAILSMSDGRTVELTAVSAKSFFRSESAYPTFAFVYTPHPDEHPDVGTFAPSPTKEKVYDVD